MQTEAMSAKQRKSKSEKKNIFNIDGMCDIENFISVTTYDGGGTCDKTFRAKIHCNGNYTLCTFEEESVSIYT